ncbi:glutathione S-transferase N-terminal domain-containing protein [Pseudoalteromonas luteoviolacea]|uniref:glutaredoxin family protein n=1 Tax=Pseudoalteromonas luteoviolacea TaxID=43657 RepID=UPI001EED1276|nr:glutaredoxin domain-containing protein [Pseudoalteromonas luteoviolacea]MCF6439025.1 glutathione S-transferase N-terminal domain-containing protein [Pseudoalteromonas luteoviolacea]
MKLIRWLLGRLILLFDFVFTPRSKKRSAQAQLQLDTITQNLKLYQFKACPFCVKVRRVAKREGLKLETRDAKSNAAYRQELLEQGGKVKVPCLRIEDQGQVTWLYESSDIVSYLQGLERSA